MQRSRFGFYRYLRHKSAGQEDHPDGLLHAAALCAALVRRTDRSGHVLFEAGLASGLSAALLSVSGD